LSAEELTAAANRSRQRSNSEDTETFVALTDEPHRPHGLGNDPTARILKLRERKSLSCAVEV